MCSVQNILRVLAALVLLEGIGYMIFALPAAVYPAKEQTYLRKGLQLCRPPGKHHLGIAHQ